MKSASGGEVFAKRFNPREAALELNRKDLDQFDRSLATVVETATNPRRGSQSDRGCNSPSRVELILVCLPLRPSVALGRCAPL